MAQVPMRKGTGPEDVTKAVLYLIEQKPYEIALKKNRSGRSGHRRSGHAQLNHRETSGKDGRFGPISIDFPLVPYM